MNFSRGNPRDPSGPWFRIGSLEVGSVDMVAGLSVISIVLYALSPPLEGALVMDPRSILLGQVWRLITWPVSVVGISLWTVVTLAVFWYFGRRLEAQIGRRRMGLFLGLTTMALSLLALALSFAFSASGPFLIGLDSLELIIVLLFIAEYPQVRFFFGIPGWVLGAVVVAVEVLSLLAARDLLLLLNLLVGFAVAAVIARSVGLLADYRSIPAFIPRRQSRPGGAGTAGKPRSKRGRRAASGATVVQGRFPGQGGVPASSPTHQELDALLDKISAGGLDSLTAKERARLMELRNRLRDG